MVLHDRDRDQRLAAVPSSWHPTRRHQVKRREPDNVTISMYRAAGPYTNSLQGAAVLEHFLPSALDPAVARYATELTHICCVQIGRLVGAVVGYPWQLAVSPLTMPGRTLG